MTLSGAQESSNVEPRLEVAVPGGRMPVWIQGEGPPVLLVHGISADHTEWRAVADGLARDHRVVAPDLLGRGASRPEPSAGFTLDDEVRRLTGVLAAAHVDRPLVAGHSHGASLALCLARRRPVRGLLLVSPITPTTRRPPLLDLLRIDGLLRAAAPVLGACRRPLTRYILTRRVYGADRPHIDDAVGRYAAPFADRARALALLRALRDWRPSELEGLEPPPGVDVRVVTGAADRRISPADTGRWAARLGAPCTVVDGAGHGVTEECPARIEALLRDIEATATGRSCTRREEDG